jgi:hypothetical protein
MNDITEGLVFRDWKITSAEPAALGVADIDMIRALIKTTVHDALYPDGIVSAQKHRRVEMIEESGKRWRGVLYAVEEQESVSHVPSDGVCWACKGYGTDMEWHTRNGRSHLIHANSECRELASEMPEQRNHRG